MFSERGEDGAVLIDDHAHRYAHVAANGAAGTLRDVREGFLNRYD